MKDSFILYTSYTNAFLGLSNEQAGELIKAIFLFVTTGEPQEISDPTTRFAYNLIIEQIIQNDRKYAQKCERLRANAQKGGLQKAANAAAANDCQQTQANATEVSKSKQMVANGSKCKQIGGDMICNDMICNDMIKEEEDNKKKDEPSLCAGAQSSSSSDYSLVVEYWNNAVKEKGSAMRPLRGLTENRKAAIRARLREHKQDGMEAIRQMIDKAVVSDFLNGRNSRNAIFTFDRLMSPSMFQKTLEGNFDNAEKQEKLQEQTSIGRLMQEQHEEPKDERQEKRERFEAMIELCRKNPKHRCMAALRMASENGTLRELGIDWQPQD